MRRMIGSVMLASLCLVAAHAQSEPPAAKAPIAEKNQRLAYLVRYGAAKDLATILTQHFDNEPRLKLVAEPTSNALLINAPAELTQELLKLLDQLDRRPRQVIVEALLADLPIDDKEAAIDPKDFSGPSDAIFAKAEALARKAKTGTIRRFRIATLENQRNMVMVGASQPIVSGVMNNRFGGGGGAAGGGAPGQAIINYREIGTTVNVTPRIGSDDLLTLEVQFEDTRMHTPENGVAIAPGVPAAEMIMSRFNGKVQVTSGAATVIRGVKSESKDAKVQTLILIAGKIITSGNATR